MTIKNEDLIEVQNLTDYQVGYAVPETNIKRGFMPQQLRKIEAGELRAVYASLGGEDLFQNYLAVKNQELATEFNIATDAFDHEYNWTVKDVDTVLKYGSTDALKDALEFGPEGIKDLIVDRAIALRIPDNNKLAAISEFTGRDISGMIQLTKDLEQPQENEEKNSGRRVISESSEKKESGRRVSK